MAAGVGVAVSSSLASAKKVSATTYSMTPNASTTGSSSSSYLSSDFSFTHSGVDWTMRYVNPSNRQTKMNQSSAGSQFCFYTGEFPGSITQVVITYGTFGTMSDSSKVKMVGSTSAFESQQTTGGETMTWDSSKKTLTWTADSSDGYVAIAFYMSGKAISGNNYLAESDAIVVTYESGGGSTPTALVAPTGLTLSGTTFTWNAVTNNNGYGYSIDTDPETTGSVAKNTVSFDVSTLTLDPGTYNFKVLTKGDGTNYTDSGYCSAVQFTVSSSSQSGEYSEEWAYADLTDKVSGTYEDVSGQSYLKVPSTAGQTATVTLPLGDIYQPTTDITVVVNIACFGTGNNPTDNTVSITASGDGQNSTWSGSGVSSLPSSSTYVNGTLTMTKTATPSAISTVIINFSVNSRVKLFRLKKVDISFEYEVDSSIAATINGDTTVSSGSQWQTGGITEDESGDPVSGATYAFESSQGVTITASSTSNGTFTATTASSGTVTVSATLEGYNIQSLVVTVDNTDPYINLSLTSGSTGYTGQTVSVSASSGHLTQDITWTVTSGSVSNPTTSNSGYSGKLASSGTVTIQASANGITQSVSVTVTKTAFTTSPSDASVNEGSDVQLSAVLNSGGAVLWESDDTSIATVDANGLVSGVSSGTTTLTAKSADDTEVKTTCEITVVEVLVASHTYSSSDGLTVNIKKGDTTVATATMDQLTASTSPQWNTQYRFYAGSILTIQPAVNYEIVKVQVNGVVNANSKGVKPTPKYYAGNNYSSVSDCTTNFTMGSEYSVDSPEKFVVYASGSAGNIGVTSILVEYKASEQQVELVEITYSGNLLKTTQYVGQGFDSVGLEFTAHYDNETTSPILTSDIAWEDLALGTSVTGSYQDVDVTVNGLNIINSSDVDEIIFFNSLSNDSTAVYSNLDSHSILGSFTTVASDKAYNGKESSLKLGSSSESGTFTLTNTKDGYYVSSVIVVAKTFVSTGVSPVADETSLKISGSEATDTYELTSSWAVYSLDVSTDEQNVVEITTSGSGHRCYIHSITMILAAEDKTAVTFAHKILDELTCTASGNSAPSTTQWGNLRTYYITGTNVSVDGKELLETTLAPYETWKDYEVTQDSTESEIICAALAKYDYVIRKYKTTNYEDFIGRFGQGKVNGQLAPSVNPIGLFRDNNTSMIAIIVIVSMVSVTAIGGYFFLRKRKEQ